MDFNIGKTNYGELMNEKTNQYNILIRNAEMTNRDNNGTPTKEEGQYYREAANVCSEIISHNLSQRAVANIWTNRKKACEAEVDRIVRFLRPPKPEAPETIENQESNNAKKDGSGSAKVIKDKSGYSVTPSGFRTRNAIKEVPAEVIEKWFKNPPLQTLDDVIGMEAQKDKLMKEAGNLNWVKTDEILKITPVKGFFFYGPPGSGKTFLIEAFANEMIKKGFKFIRLLGGDIHASLVGVAEKTIETAFKEVIDNEPCIIFIDEIENVCVNRAAPHVEGHEKRLTVAFLEAYNVLKESGKRAIFMGATNFPSRVDEAMLDRITLIPVPLPDEQMRKYYFEKAFKYIKLEEGFTVESMVERTDNYSFRDMERLATSVNINIRELAVEQFKVLNDKGEVDLNATDEAAFEAIRNKKIVLTETMFEKIRVANPPSNKEESRAELTAFEAKINALVN